MFDDQVFDVICIGGGMAGLTASNILLKEGFKVLIIERNPKVGGCAVNFKRKGYRFDTAIHFINGCSEGGMIYDVLKLFDAHKSIEFIPLKELMHWVDLKNDIEYHAPLLLKDHVESLVEKFPHEERGIRKFYDKYSKVVSWLMDFIRRKNLFTKIGHFFIRLPTSIRFLRTVYKPIGTILNKYFKDDALKETITALCTSFGLYQDEMSALSFLMAEMAVRFEGAFYPKGGAGKLSQTLADCFIENGGQILLKNEAIGLNIEGKKVRSVTVKDTNDKETTIFGRTFIINSDITNFANQLCPPNSLPESYLKKIQERKTSYSNVICFLGLDIDLREYGINDYILWQFGRSAKNPENIKRIIENRDYSKLPIENIAIYSNIDPSCCPPGKSLLTAIYYTTIDPYKHFLTTDGKYTDEYYLEKDRIKDQFIGWLSTTLGIPDLAEAVKVCEIATPLTLQKFTGNKNGANFGWFQTANQLMKNPINPQTPFRNVILAGHWTFPGGGIASVMLSGYAASKKIIKKLK